MPTPSTKASRGDRTAPEERMVNLVMALMATTRGITKDAIVGSVTGYREQVESGASKDAVEKMFERDKESLRGLGIPVETIGDGLDPDDLREARYRIPQAEYALPAEVTFTAAEIAVLNLVGDVWSQSSMSAHARSGLRKLRARGNAVDEQIIGYAPRISLRDAAFMPLQGAIEQCRHVSFSYLKPGETRSTVRRLAPLALVEYEARWHVYGMDLRLQEPRTFLLARINSPVTVTRARFDPALRDGAGVRALAGLQRLAAGQHARIHVEPGSEAWLRLSRRGQVHDQEIDVPYVDVHVLADELASYGPEARVLTPVVLRDEVVARLRAVVAANGSRE